MIASRFGLAFWGTAPRLVPPLTVGGFLVATSHHLNTEKMALVNLPTGDTLPKHKPTARLLLHLEIIGTGTIRTPWP